MNSNEEESLAMQLEELENIHGEHLNSAADDDDDDDVPALLSGQSMSSEDSVDQEGRQFGRDLEGRQFTDGVGVMFGKEIEGRQRGWKNPCPRWPINPHNHGLIRNSSPTTRSDVSYLFHRARCDSEDGSLSSSIGKVPRLAEREIIDNSDDESQASNGSLEEGFSDEYLVGHMFVPTRKETNEDGNGIGSMKSECSDSSKKMPLVKRLKLEDDGSVGSNISVNSSSSDGSDSRGPPPLVLHRYDHTNSIK